MNESISALEIDKQKSEIKYYQWVGLFLIFQAYMFYIPRIYWKTYSDRGGLYVGDLVSFRIDFLLLNSIFKIFIL